MVKYLLITLFSLNIILSTQDDPKVALVLSGGAAKGYAHIPVIQMIDSLDIKIDMIVGTSIGAIVGALYSAGYTGNEIYKFGFNTDWGAIFLDKSNREDMSYIHKKETSKYQIDFNLDGFTPKFQSGAIHGQKAYVELSTILGQYEYIKDFNNLHIPFYCNATDLISGDDILFSEGSLITSIRSSISIPSVFTPVNYRDYLLVDGGVKNNIPVNIAKDLGADIIFTSIVASSKPDKKELQSSIIDVIGESIFIHTSDLNKSNIEKSDYVLSIKIPKGSGANFTDKSIQEIYTVGKKEVYKEIDLFIDLKNTVGNKKARPLPPKLDELNLITKNIKVKGNKNLTDSFIINGFGLYQNDTLKLESIHNGINNLYGLGYFNTIRYDLIPNEDLTHIDIEIIVDEESFDKFQTGLRWDNFHELIAVANIKTNDLIIPGLLIENEFQFPGIRKNTFSISYPRKVFNIPFYPFYRNEYLKKNVDWYNSQGVKTAIYNMKILKNKLGIGFIFGKNTSFEIGAESESATFVPEIWSSLTFGSYRNSRVDLAPYVNINFDSRDNILLTKNGALINFDFIIKDNTHLTMFDFDLYTTAYRTTFRTHGIYRNVGIMSAIHNTVFQGDIFRTAGYQPYFLTSNELFMIGIEWMYHYKEMHFRIFANDILSFYKFFDEQNYKTSKEIISTGFGITFTSIFGPLDFVYAIGPKSLLDTKEAQSILYFNFGYKF